MAGLPVPIVCAVIGEGGSGGALALGVGNRILMQEYATYSVISPEGCASILWRDDGKKPEAAAAMKITATDLQRLGVVDEVIAEAPGGAHRDHDASAKTAGRGAAPAPQGALLPAARRAARGSLQEVPPHGGVRRVGRQREVTEGNARAGREALRLNARYVEEVVIGWGLCPWAARAWNDGQVDQRVFTDAALDDARRPARSSTSSVARPDAAIGLAIFPRVACTVGAWEQFAEHVRRTPPAIRSWPRRFIPTTARARSAPTPSSIAARLVPFIRRTPDPTLQLVRASLVDRLRGEVSADVARANFANVTGRGLAALDALLTDIRRDRDASYARLC